MRKIVLALAAAAGMVAWSNLAQAEGPATGAMAAPVCITVEDWKAGTSLVDPQEVAHDTDPATVKGLMAQTGAPEGMTAATVEAYWFTARNVIGFAFFVPFNAMHCLIAMDGTQAQNMGDLNTPGAAIMGHWKVEQANRLRAAVGLPELSVGVSL